MLKPLNEDQGYLKAGLLGFTASGKTYTAMLLAIATRRYFGSDGPIAMYDTEGGSQYLKTWVAELTGQPLLGVRTRSFADLLAFGTEAEASGISVAIVDSIAHPWEELKESYLADLNAARAAKGWDARRLEFQDWGKIKPMWAEWTNFFLNSKLHLIVCGRAGDIYEMERNEETGRKELAKTGTRMVTEKNFGYEPSLLVEMSREQILEPTTHFILRATVWKDRFAAIQGEIRDFRPLPRADPTRREQEIAAVWDFLGQHVALLKPGGQAAIDLTSKTATGANEAGEDQWMREKRKRTILIEEIEGELFAAYPGQKAEEKKARQELVKMALDTRSWTALEGMESARLREGLGAIRMALSSRPPSPAEEG